MLRSFSQKSAPRSPAKFRFKKPLRSGAEVPRDPRHMVAVLNGPLLFPRISWRGMSASGRQIRKDYAVLCPQPKAAAKSIGVGTLATTRRQGFEPLDIAATDHRIVWLQRGDEALDDIGDVASPLLFAVA